MKSTTAIGVLALVAGAVAHEHAHEKFHQQRAAQDSAACNVAATVTSYGEWKLVPVTSTSTTSTSCTSTSTSSTSSSSTSTSTSVAPVTTSSTSSISSSSAAAPPTYSAPVESSSAPAYQYKAATTTDTPAPAVSVQAPSTSSSTAPQSAGSCAAITPNGNKWAFCYTPYTSSGDCKTADQVNSDIAALKAKGFTSIRTYANDCNGVANVGSAARANGMKMLVGINIDGSGIGSYTDAQVSSLLSWGAGNWDLVEMVIAGNEAIFNGWASPSALAGFIGSVKSQLSAAGYCGPVTTTEPLNIIEANGPVICGAVDVIGANIHPFFNGAVDASSAGTFVASQLSDLAGVCGNSKAAYILETGWPSAGSANGAAIPGFDTQKTAVDGIMASSGSKAAVFSFLNDQWKAPGPFGVEQNWGCADLF